MTILEALYGKKYKTTLYAFEAEENLILAHDTVQQTMEKIKMIRKN